MGTDLGKILGLPVMGFNLKAGSRQVLRQDSRQDELSTLVLSLKDGLGWDD